MKLMKLCFQAGSDTDAASCSTTSPWQAFAYLNGYIWQAAGPGAAFLSG